MSRRALGLLIVLGACAAPDAPPEGMGMIVVASGGSMFGSTATTIYADGTVVLDNAMAGSDPVHRIQKGSPDAFVAAAAVIAAEGARAKAAPKTDTEFCMDYGTDQVRADPPIAGFDQVSTGCPNDAVTALMDHVLAALVPQ